jgi:hypothetical protein
LKSVLDSRLVFGPSDQQSDWCWMDLNSAVNHPDVHVYVQTYARHLL